MRKKTHEWYFIKGELSSYEILKKRIVELSEDIIYTSSVNDGQPKGNATTHMTEDKAIKLASSITLLELKRRVEKLSYVVNSLDEEHKRFFDLYFTKKKGIIYISLDMNIAERTAREWREDIIKSTMKVYGFENF